MLRGFQADDLHHLHILNDTSDKFEDISFVYDSSLALCAEIKGCREIFLFGTRTTDKGINFIKDLPNLHAIDVSADTMVTTQGVQSL